MVATTSRYSPPPLSAMMSPAMTLSSTSQVFLKDDLAFESSADIAVALAKSSWKQDTSELAEGSSSSSTRKSNRSVSKSWAAALERGGGKKSDPSSFLAISSSSSSSSSDEDDDDDYYGTANSSSSQSHVASRNLRTQNSRTPSSSISATPPEDKSPPARFPAVTRNNRSRFSESEEEEDEDEDEDEDDDEEEEKDDDQDDDDDDDVPLAQRIPGALTAQKSIRRQVRQEREKKKRVKALRDHHADTSRTRLMTLRPGASPSSSHDVAAALVASQTTSMERNSRSLKKNGSRFLNPDHENSMRKKGDIDGQQGSVSEAATTSVDAAALYQRLNSLHRSKSMTRSLRDVRPPSTELPPVPFPSSYTQQSKNLKEPSSFPYHYHTSPSPTPINSAYAPSSMARLRPMRSFHFHRPSIDSRPIGMDDPRSVPLPLDAERRISQNSSKSRPPTRDGPKQQTSNFSTTTTTTPTQHHHHHRTPSGFERALVNTNSQPVPPIPTTQSISHGSSRISSDTSTDKHSKATLRQHRSAPSVSSPANSLPMTIINKPELVDQQRVFIGNMQRFNMVEIGASTTAGDIIEMIEAEGTFKDFSGSGGWMVFEVAQDFGMERPIRSFELVSDVQSSWNKDKMVNYLVLRMTPLEVPLNRSAIPSSSPTHSGYVEWEAKRGKWSKRFMQLREHSIWISKRDTGQDQVHICSLSNFDAYRVTRNHRAPKPFAFAVKSTDNLSFFENTADYLHSFACSEKEGKIWMEKILVARSYVLFQERHVLFNPKVAGGNASRPGTRKPTIQRSQ